MRTHIVLVIFALLLPACGASVNSVARQASKAAVDEGAEELTRQDTQQSLKTAAEDPQIQAATQAMTEQVAAGILEALNSDDARKQIAGLTKTAVDQLVASLGSPTARTQLVGLTSAMADGALRELGQTLQQDFRPEMRAWIREDFSSALAGALQAEELKPALSQAAQTVAYNAVVGANRGLGAAWTGEEGMMGEARTMSGSLAGLSMTWVWIGLTAMGLFTLMLIAGAAMMIARARSTRHEVERLESAALLLATAMREKQQTQQTDEIVSIVQQALEGRAERTGKHRILSALRMRDAG